MKIVILPILLLSLCLLACTTSREAWIKTSRYNSIGAYQNFLAKYPNSEFDSEARRRIEKLSWEEAQRINAIWAYKNFISDYPNGEFVTEAKEKIEELEAVKSNAIKSGDLGTVPKMDTNIVAAKQHLTLSEEVKTEINRLRSQSAADRGRAAYALGNMGKEALPAVPHLIGILGDSSSLKASGTSWSPATGTVQYGGLPTSPGELAAEALKKITGKDFVRDREKWYKWWVDNIWEPVK